MRSIATTMPLLRSTQRRMASFLSSSTTSPMPPKRLVASHISDYIVIVTFAAIGGALNYVKAFKNRPFSLSDLSISYPYIPQAIDTTGLGLIALLAPAVIITALSFLIKPGIQHTGHFTKAQTLRRKLWELHAGLSGLTLSIALSYFLTQGLKTLFPKPRPHFMAVCNPDVTNTAAHIIGGNGREFNLQWNLVSSTICTPHKAGALPDAFRSFPSGHCSFAFAGLLYLSLYLCSKLDIAIPYLHRHSLQLARRAEKILPLDGNNVLGQSPNYGIILALIPVSVATWIASTRYIDFWHFGFDCLAGSLLGSLTAWFSFRWYHLPILGGVPGGAWSARYRDRAFGLNVKVDGDVRRLEEEETVQRDVAERRESCEKGGGGGEV